MMRSRSPRRPRRQSTHKEFVMAILRPVMARARVELTCGCDGTGWLLIENSGVKECFCRLQARLAPRLEQIPPEYEHLRLESISPNLKRHPRQSSVWQTVKAHPDRCYLICGRPGAGKSAVMWALYARAVEQNRPAVAMSLSE